MGELRPGVIFLEKQQDRVFLPVVRGVGQAALQKWSSRAAPPNSYVQLTLLPLQKISHTINSSK